MNYNSDNNLEINSSNNTITFSETSNLKSTHKNNKNFLYNNNFFENKKPIKLGGTRNILYINDYPYISIGKNISMPLLVILVVCLVYIYIFYFFFEDSGPFLQKMFNYCFLCYIISHLFCIFLNPGIPSFKYNSEIIEKLKSKEINELDCTKCKICNLTYKLTDRIEHCDKCEICYYGYDHHCIWIGHCIGKYNGIFFVFFILGIFIFFLICLAIIFVKILKLFIN